MQHHYVPQFLLSAWAETTLDRKIQVFRLDLPQMPSRRLTPKYTGYEDDLYALSRPIVAGMGKQAVETLLFKHVDNLAALVRQKMERSGLKSLTVNERSDWVRFLISLRTRHPEAVASLKSDASALLSKTLAEAPQDYEAIADAEDPVTLEDWAEQRFPGLVENFGLSFFDRIITDQKAGDDIFRMKWWVWNFAERGHAMILSDRPCILTSGLASAECILALPISPTKAFLATRGDRTAVFLRRQDPKRLAVSINESSVAQSRVRIFAQSDSVTRFISNRLRQRSTG